MRIILLGNAGAGKSTLAGQLLEKTPAGRLSLDEVAFADGAERRSLPESLADIEQFMSENDSWIMEGCYADIIEPVLKYCDTLIFLNPGVDTCVSHCRARPWEPGKFASREEQDANLDNLIAWVREYGSRTDEYGLHRHQQLFASYQGRKLELNDPADYGTAVNWLFDHGKQPAWNRTDT